MNDENLENKHIRLKTACASLNLKIDDVVKIMGYSASKLKSLRNANQTITPEIAMEFEVKLKINASWLIFGRGEMLITKMNLDSDLVNNEKSLKLSKNEVLKKLEDREKSIDFIKDEIEEMKKTLL